jgi:hypothetical protein
VSLAGKGEQTRRPRPTVGVSSVGTLKHSRGVSPLPQAGLPCLFTLLASGDFTLEESQILNWTSMSIPSQPIGTDPWEWERAVLGGIGGGCTADRSQDCENTKA